ncbi:MAG: hypothetical protein SFY68_14575 [Candidatus Sumerlaeia bacterium]|nr:hypothetical protein [Candidatus Sumerlaeia bacterium]
MLTRLISRSSLSLCLTLLVFLSSLGLVGCNTNTKPPFKSDNETDLPSQFRRYTKRPAVDYVFRWNSQAFELVTSDDFDLLSEDKRSALGRLGKPQYVRENIRAQRNENFDEWVYWDDNIILQFVGGSLVYEGELLDSDRTLVEYGYPSRAYFQEYEIGPVRETWIYEGTLELGGRTVSFSDGKKIFQAVQ